MLRISLVILTISLGLAVVLVRTGVSPWLRLLLMLPFWMAFHNMYQGFLKT